VRETLGEQSGDRRHSGDAVRLAFQNRSNIPCDLRVARRLVGGALARHRMGHHRPYSAVGRITPISSRFKRCGCTGSGAVPCEKAGAENTGTARHAAATGARKLRIN
jgi:hypothetical protein